jgi:hypothetical protein
VAAELHRRGADGELQYTLQFHWRPGAYGDIRGRRELQQQRLGSEPHTVNLAATTTSITDDSPVDPTVVGQSFTVSFAVNPAFTGTPTGNVMVSDGWIPALERLRREAARWY